MLVLETTWLWTCAGAGEVVNDDVFEAEVENSEVHSDDFGQPCCN